MSILKKTETARRICPVIFMLDTSGSMAGPEIGAVNAAMEGILPEIISMNNDNPDVQIEIGVMTFDSDARWVSGNNGLVNPENYAWNDLDAGGYTAMGAAFSLLDKALSASQGFMSNASGSVAPVIFLLTDGEPSDEYTEGLQKLQANNWYKVAVRVALAYGQQANDSVLVEFTKNSETVLRTNNPEALKKLIKFVTITSSMVASKGKPISSQSTNQIDQQSANDMTNVLANELKDSPPTLDNDDDVW
jgi:uncharacterized protein YegL